VERVRDFVRRLDPDGAEPEGMDAYLERLYDALADDFNTAMARAVLFEWISEGNRRLDAGERLGPGRLGEMLYALGLENLLEPEKDDVDPEAERLLREREEARAARDFATADARRDELAALGWEVRDTAEGPRLVRRG
jgi:cysteinyl-tRNA synthetase